MSGFFIIITLLMSSVSYAAPSYLAYGDLRGHIEPCGCDPSTDLGGIKRLSAFISRERSARPDLILFDLGNDLPLPDQDGNKTRFLLAAQAAIRPSAVLFNELEIRRWAEVKSWLGSSSGLRIPYLISNLDGSGDYSAVTSPVISGKGWVALGYSFADSTVGVTVRVDKNLLGRWRVLLESFQRDERILLFSGNESDLKTILGSNLFGVIISSNKAALTALPGPEDRQDEGRLRRHQVPPVFMVPLAGQGILRGGSLIGAEAPSLATILAKPTSPSRSDGPPTWLQDGKQFSWLDSASAMSGSPVDVIYNEYTQATKSRFLAESVERELSLKGTAYAGASVCESCHSEAYRVYNQSAHSHALATLQKKGKHEDPECISCHVLGAKDQGGFVSLEKSPQFANVQCENCHGPRLQHSKNPRAHIEMVKANESVCLGCHNRQHSPRFDFKSYWPKIVHK